MLSSISSERSLGSPIRDLKSVWQEGTNQRGDRWELIPRRRSVQINSDRVRRTASGNRALELG